MNGQIHIRNIEFQGNHGASAAERRSTRRFQVDVDLELPIGRAMETDRLSDTVDYYEVCDLIVEIGTKDPHRLLESLSGAMLQAIKRRWPSARVQIELRKLHPPCPGNPSFTAVRVAS